MIKRVIPEPARSQLNYATHKAQVTVMGQIFKRLPKLMPFTFTGPDSTYKLLEAIVDAGYSRTLVCADPGLVKLGLIQPFLDRLEELNVTAKLFDGIQPDPSYDIIDAGIAAAKAHNCDSILAIGGGSTLDASKVVAACKSNKCKPRKLAGYFKVRKPMVPYYGVPTTSGTGSEVTMAAVVSDTEKQAKIPFADPKLVPHTIALDPNLQLGLPASITAATGMDAMTHALESYVSGYARADTRTLSKTAARMIFNYLPIAYKDGKNVEAREKMLMASTYAGLAFTNASLGYVHAIAHQLGARYHTPHGLANAMILPHVFEFYLGGDSDAVKQLADLADIVGVAEKKDDQFTKASKFVDAIKELNDRIGIPATLDALQEEDIDSLIDQALGEAQGTYDCPRYMEEEDCRGILRKLLG